MWPCTNCSSILMFLSCSTSTNQMPTLKTPPSNGRKGRVAKFRVNLSLWYLVAALSNCRYCAPSWIFLYALQLTLGPLSSYFTRDLIGLNTTKSLAFEFFDILKKENKNITFTLNWLFQCLVAHRRDRRIHRTLSRHLSPQAERRFRKDFLNFF